MNYKMRNMKTNLLVFGLMWLATTAFAQKKEWQDPKVNEINRLPMHANYFAFADEESALRETKEESENFMTLNGTWKFFWVKDANMRSSDFYEVEFNDKGWDNIEVPAMWELNGYGDPVYVNTGYPWRSQFKNDPPNVPVTDNHVGSYRKEIIIPANWNGKEIIAHFGSVTSNMYLWVNGKFVGYSEDSKLEAEFNLTKYVKPGKNLIAFQVFRWCDGTYLEDQDFLRLSGVGRDCYLYARTPTHIQDIRITPDLDAMYRDATLRVDLTLKGTGDVGLKLLDDSGNQVAETKVKGTGKIMAELAISNPAKWTAETPALYTLVATLHKDKQTLEVIPQKVGFRKIEIRNAQLLINGQPVLFKGVNRHEMDPDKGYVVSRERMIQDIRIMKELNVNAVRTCHYPDDAQWYDLCDQYGIYMVAEANVEAHGMGYGEETLAKNPSYAKAHLERNQRNVQRSYNNPSVIFWSLGNESGFGPNFEACYKWIKQEDKTRPVQYEKAGRTEFTDIYCPMYYGYNGCVKYCEDEDNRPLIQCEYAHAMGNSMGGFKEYWDLIRKYPKYQGGFIWDFVDQSIRWETKEGIPFYAYGGDWNRYDGSDNNFMNNGLINPDRKPNPHAFEVKYFHQSIWAEPLEIEKGLISIYNENFFRDLSNYYLEWTLLADGDVQQTGIVQKLDVKPQQTGTIKLDYDLSAISSRKELLLNIAFKLKKQEPLLAAGHSVAKKQILVRPYIMPDLVLQNETSTNVEIVAPVILDNDRYFLVVKGERFRLDFDREDGLLCRYDVNGLCLLKEDGKLKPNFWRAPTDNDIGTKANNKYRVWNTPEMKLLALNSSKKDGMVVVTAEYKLEQVQASLKLTYVINNKGTVKVTQEMLADKSAKMPDLFRFGMQLELSKRLGYINYYGRGPKENYIDRKNSADIGNYMQTVEDQFYSYIRPQENGTKTDIRWWQQTNKGGEGLRFVSDVPFSASALRYSIESLDDGVKKDQRHSELVPQVDYVNTCIDKVQMGLGCVNSWGALPLEKYRLPYGDYTFSFIMQPL